MSATSAAASGAAAGAAGGSAGAAAGAAGGAGGGGGGVPLAGAAAAGGAGGGGGGGGGVPLEIFHRGLEEFGSFKIFPFCSKAYSVGLTSPEVNSFGRGILPQVKKDNQTVES